MREGGRCKNDEMLKQRNSTKTIYEIVGCS